MAEPGVYKIRYARHVLSESNAKDNSGVDKHDPVITTPEVEARWLSDGNKLDIEKRGHGRQYAEGTMRMEWSQHEKKASVFMVSPLTRVIQTFLLSVTEEELRTARIIIEPLLIEQTLWFSDRPRAVVKIQKMIEEELKYRFKDKLKLEDLNIEWNRMLPLPSETKENEKLPKDWHLKINDWAPENLLYRGQRALQAILAECKSFKSPTGQPYTDYDLCVFGHGGFVNCLAEEIGHIDINPTVPKLSAWRTGEIRDYKIYNQDPVPLLVREGQQKFKGRQKEAENKKRDDLRDHIVKMVTYTDKQEAEFLEWLTK